MFTDLVQHSIWSYSGYVYDSFIVSDNNDKFRRHAQKIR